MHFVPFARLRRDVPFARLRRDVPFARLRRDVPFARLRRDVPFARLRRDVSILCGSLLIAYAALSVAPAPAAAQDPAAERLYAEASRLMQSGEGDRARDELQLLVQQFPQDRLAPKALLQIAEIQHALGNLQATRLVLEQLRAEYGRSLESAAAFVKQADIEVQEARRLADLEEARSTFRRVPLLYGRESYPDLEARVRARIRTGEISLQLGDDENAVSEFLAAVEDEPPGPSTGRARLLLATALTRRGEWVAAAEVLQRLASEDGSATSTANDRGRAVRLLSLIHRRLVRPLSGSAVWPTASRYPAGGLQLKEPSGVAAAEDGRLVITDRRLKSAVLLDADGQVQQRATIEATGHPGWSAGAPYLVTELGISAPFDGRKSPRFLEPRPGKEKPLKDLLAAERGRFDDWFIIARGWKSLLSFTSPRQGQSLLAANRPVPVDLAQDHLGRIYLLDGGSKTVLRLGVDRRQVDTVLRSAWKRPVALALDPLGNTYVLDRGHRTVEMFNAAGKRQARLGPQLGAGIELKKPVDLAVDGSGRVFIADSDLPFVVMLD